MAKLLLWIAIGVGGTLGALVPTLFGSQDMAWAIVFSTLGSIVGIWFWYKFLRFY